MTDLYKWSYHGETAKELPSSALVPLGMSINDVVSKTKQTAYEQTIVGLTDQALQQGITVTIKSVTTNAGYTERSYWERAGVRVTVYKIWVSIEAEFESDKPLMGSPVALALMIILKWIMEAIVIVLVAYFAIQMIGDVFKSMTTKTSTVTKTTYDESGNPVSTTTETTTEPSPTGWIGVIVALGLVLGVLVVLPKLLEKEKGKRRR
jgi:hypothetical protein